MRSPSYFRPLFSLVILTLGLSGSLMAANANGPHPHQGVVTPYDGAPPEVDLDASETATLNSGSPVYKQVEVSGGGRAVAVFRVKAPVNVVWSVISDFGQYPQWIPSLTKTQIYKREGDKIFVEFVLNPGFFLPKYTYYIEHSFPMEKEGWGTWKLDYSRHSDLDDSVGFWRVKAAPGSSTESIVTYSIDVRIASAVPAFIKNIIVNSGLKEATQWVKVQSEKRAGH